MTPPMRADRPKRGPTLALHTGRPGPELDPVTLCRESRLVTFLGTIMLKGDTKNGKGKKR
jgi:hypothetical protein